MNASSPKHPLLLAAATLLLLWPTGRSLGQQGTAEPPREGKPPTVPYQVKVGAPREVQMGQTVSVGVYGALAKKISDKLNSNAPGAADSLKLYLNGVLMTGIKPTILGPGAFLPQTGTDAAKGTDAKGIDAAKGASAPEFVLQFPLDRDAQNQANREAWDTLLSRLPYGAQPVQLGVSLDNDVPSMADRNELLFQAAPGPRIAIAIAGGLVLFFLLMWWAIATTMLREAGASTAYSLGKSQMAFWGLLVAASFAGVWFVGHRMERIPPQVLVLLGISGTTGLSAILIGQSKKASAQGEQPDAQKALDEANRQLAERAAEKTSLEQEKGALPAGTPFAPAKEQRLAAIPQEMQSLQTEATRQQDFLNGLKKTAKGTLSSGSWFKDIISDEHGLSFHRFQVVLWTVILGVVFAWTVANTFSMPEFENTLLILMGISNSLYLGFKIPEDTPEKKG